MSRLLVAIAGGSASGKTTLAEAIRRLLEPMEVRLIREDEYYRDHGYDPAFDPLRYNFDDVTAHDHALMAKQLSSLKKGKAVDAPLYDFATHSRKDETRRVQPADIIIVEGIHVLADPDLTPLYDLTVYVDAPADVRLARRILRDVRERGRSVESVVIQYLRSVRPSHLKFTEPGKAIADIVVTNDAAAAEPELEALRPSFNALAEPVAARISAMLKEG
ncbi:uridine kinase [Hyphobacterium marinum]|uniref:uridine/cytidine kinase n=1 Tax=Hyphobacterium marinum TaxID=3116574 RepID=A0ABU7LUV8_9PROT|nr:uridine kinase [Hyphobacterium sp. Y6023]MEE2565276.1 uridine kinase [Hyphobacterium sp. Y6023]